MDIVSRPTPSVDPLTSGSISGHLTPGTTVPGTTELRPGGVARNVHEAAFKLGCEDAALIAPIGKSSDPLALILEQGLVSFGAGTEGLVRLQGETPSVNMLLNATGTLDRGVAATQMVEKMSWKDV